MVTGGPWTCYRTRRLFIIIKWNNNNNILPLAAGLLCVSPSRMPFLRNIHRQTALSHGSNCHHLWAMNLSWTSKFSVTDHAGPWTHELRCSRCHWSHPMNLWSKWYSIWILEQRHPLWKDSTSLTLGLLAPLHVESLPSEGRRLPTVSNQIEDQTWSLIQNQ